VLSVDIVLVVAVRTIDAGMVAVIELVAVVIGAAYDVAVGSGV
jgi:hypothetical protein